ncbi:MAG: hypothetical protein FJZ43_04520 [Candidatus Staskawiczbacteria bacterium]|nr:hypothetical protein [Candidatus Staskawiczbacteria bacterium]
MRSLTLAVIILFAFQFVALASSQGIPTQQKTVSEEQQAESNRLWQEREFRYTLFNFALYACIIITILIGIWITRLMLRNNNIPTNWIIHIMFALGGLAIFVPMIIDTISCFNSIYCGFTPIHWLFLGSSLPLVIVSLLIIKNLKKYGRNIKYQTNLSASLLFWWLILTALLIVAELIIKPIYDFPAYIIIPIFWSPFMFLLYIILGIVGMKLDKKSQK